MNGFDNLYCMEVEPTVDMDELAVTDGMNQDAADGIKRWATAAAVYSASSVYDLVQLKRNYYILFFVVFRVFSPILHFTLSQRVLGHVELHSWL